MRWEYKAIRLTDPFDEGIKLTEVLNVFGDDRWKLISSDLGQSCFVFMRPKFLDIKAKELFDGDVAELRKVIEGYFGGKIG